MTLPCMIKKRCVASDTVEKRDSGFTLIEVMMAVAALSIIGAIVYGAFSRFRTASVVDEASREVLSTLRMAQSKTLASESNTRYGVRILQNQIMTFSGAAYDANNITETISLSPAVSITGINLGGGVADVVFERLTGRTANFGSLKVEAVSSPGISRDIVIDASGNVNLAQAALTPTGTRITDTRHVNF